MRHVELEISLLNFALIYKSNVMTDISLISLGDSLLDDNDEEEDSSLKYETKSSYDKLAQLSGYNSMAEVLDVFTQKIISNLMASSANDKGENKWIVDLSLEVFSEYLHNRSTCRQLTALPIVK